jgi:hypothetical protein
MQARYDQIVALTDEFCNRHLNDEYRELAQYMAAALCRKRPSPVASGQVRSWACGIIYALGQVNFLSDKSFEPYMTMADVCAEFGVGQSTGEQQGTRDLGRSEAGSGLRSRMDGAEHVGQESAGLDGRGERLPGGPSHHAA